MKKPRLYNKVNGTLLKEKLFQDNVQRTTLSFYQYAKVVEPASFRDELYLGLDQLDVKGRIYIAQEGINGQLSIPNDNLVKLRELLESISILSDVRLNIAIEDDGKSFYKLKIKLRSKIVADGLNDDTFDVTQRGHHLDASGFNEVSTNPKSIVVDMRNHYESEVGHFKGAILPEADTFREALPEVLEKLKDQKDKPIIMYCTGGIRCEKASAYLKHKGFEEVYQLDGGIIEYARQVKSKNLENKFIGKNFVFDERLGERITEEVVAVCHQCGNSCDEHVNCANDACHLLFIQCSECAQKYDDCCSKKCSTFNQLSIDEQRIRRKEETFNGSKFSKGRYKSFKPNMDKINDCDQE